MEEQPKHSISEGKVVDSYYPTGGCEFICMFRNFTNEKLAEFHKYVCFYKFSMQRLSFLMLRWMWHWD